MSVASVSLLIPCFNAARFLPRLMSAVQRVNPGFQEWIAYDDGSSDETPRVARELGVPLIHPNPNRGVSHARNCLARVATSEWLHFHDPDDLIEPEFLAELMPHAAEQADVITCDADWLGEHDGKLQIAWRYDALALAADPAPALLERPMSLNNGLIRRSAWERIGGCDENLRRWEDADVMLRLALAGCRFRHVPRVLTKALRRDDSLSADPLANARAELLYLEKHRTHPRSRPFVSALGARAERLAARLIELQDGSAARQALALARVAGLRPPSSRQPLWALLRPFVSDYTLMRWQTWLRRSA